MERHLTDVGFGQFTHLGPKQAAGRYLTHRNDGFLLPRLECLHVAVGHPKGAGQYFTPRPEDVRTLDAITPERPDGFRQNLSPVPPATVWAERTEHDRHHAHSCDQRYYNKQLSWAGRRLHDRALWRTCLTWVAFTAPTVS
jgi:hypothetical protein